VLAQSLYNNGVFNNEICDVEPSPDNIETPKKGIYKLKSSVKSGDIAAQMESHMARFFLRCMSVLKNISHYSSGDLKSLHTRWKFVAVSL